MCTACHNPNLSPWRKTQQDGLAHGVILVSQCLSQIAPLWMRWLVRSCSAAVSFTQSITMLHRALRWAGGCRGTTGAPPGQSVVMSIKTGICECTTFPLQAGYLLFMSVFGNGSADWLIGQSTREALSPEMPFNFDHPQMWRHCPLQLHSSGLEWNLSLYLHFTYTSLQDKLGILWRYLLSMRKQSCSCVFVCESCQICLSFFSSNFLQIDAMIPTDKMVLVFIHHRGSLINSNQAQTIMSS